jgi:hypothetical protein
VQRPVAEQHKGIFFPAGMWDLYMTLPSIVSAGLRYSTLLPFRRKNHNADYQLVISASRFSATRRMVNVEYATLRILQMGMLGLRGYNIFQRKRVSHHSGDDFCM